MRYDLEPTYDAEELARWRAKAEREVRLRSEFPDDLRISNLRFSSKKGSVAPVSLWWDQLHEPHSGRLVWALDRIAKLESRIAELEAATP